jgi:serine protease inhibitor
MKASRLLFSLCLLMLAGVACNKSGRSPDAKCDPKTIALTPAEQNVIAAQNRFAFDYLHQALLHDPDANNKMISPLSIYIALAMVYNGADQSTKDAMQEALRLHNISIEDLNKTCRAIIGQLPEADCKVLMTIANSLWYKPGYSPLESFSQTNTAYYHAVVNPFADPDPVATINKWVSDNTKEKITKIIDKISPNEILFLINAIYFKGVWMNQFDKSKTTDNIFHKAGGNTVSTPFMKMECDSLKIFHHDSLQMVELPYGGGNFAMYVILPAQQVTAMHFASHMSAASFSSLRSQMQARKVLLSLPKFKYGYEIKDMKPDLTGMGMGIAFGDAANFSKMYTQSVAISRAIHKTFIEVNEEGTEAAAVTAVGVGLTSLPQTLQMTVDRPFVYVIAEKTSGVILFTGIVNDPSVKE